MNMLQLGLILTAYDKMSGVVDTALGRVSKGLSNVRAKAVEASRKLAEVGTMASLGGHKMLDAMRTPLSAFAEQDAAFNNLGVAMMDNLGKIPPQMSEIKRQAVDLGNVLPGTTADMVNAATALLENGTAIETVVNGGMKASAYLGVILKQAPAQAAEMVAKFREAFGLSEHELTKMADLTQKAKFAFGLNPEEVKYAAQYAGSTLNNLKLTGIENTKMFLAMQGIARQKGMEGSVFGTNFASMLNNIGQMEQKLGRNSKIMKEVNADLEQAGIHMRFFDQAGKFVGLEKMVGELEKLKVLSEQDKLNVMNKIFGMEGGRVASILSGAGVEKLYEAMGNMDHQADIMQRIDLATKSARNTWEAFTGTLTNFWAAVGEPAMTALYPMLQAVNDFVGGPLMEWAKGNQELVKWLGLAAIGGGVLLVALGGLGIGLSLVLRGALLAVTGVQGFAKGVWWVVKAIGFLGEWLGRAMVILAKVGWVAARVAGPLLLNFGKVVWMVAVDIGKAMVWALGAAAKAFLRLGAAMLATPIGWIIAAIAAIAAGAYLIWRNWDTVKAWFTRFWGWLKGMFNQIVAWFAGLGAQFIKAGENIITSIWQGITSKAGMLLDKVKEVAGKVRAYWPFSPAKEGPLRDIHRIRLVETLAAAITPGPLVKAASGVAAAAMLALAPLAAPVASAPVLAPGRMSPLAGAGSGGQGVTIQFSPQITVRNAGGGEAGDIRDQVLAALRQSEQELVRIIEDVQRRNARRGY